MPASRLGPDPRTSSPPQANASALISAATPALETRSPSASSNPAAPELARENGGDRKIGLGPSNKLSLPPHPAPLAADWPNAPCRMRFASATHHPGHLRLVGLLGLRSSHPKIAQLSPGFNPPDVRHYP